MHVRPSETQLQLFDERAVYLVSSPGEGVLRVRHSPRAREVTFAYPELPPKASVAVEAPKSLPLTVRDGDAHEIGVSVAGARLVIAKEPFTWRFEDAQGRVLARSLRIEGTTTAGYPVARMSSVLTLEAPEREAYLGFGEKVGPLDKRGMRFTFWNTDVLPHQPDTDPLYVSIPFFIGLREGVAWGLFLDETWRSHVDVALADDRKLRWEVEGPELDAYLISGPRIEDVVRRYSELTGRAPLPPLWSLGAHQSRWGYESARDVTEMIAAYRRHELPLDCVHVDIDYMEGFKVWTWDRSRFPDPAALARDAGERGVRLVTIVDPSIQAERGYEIYDEAQRRDFLVRHDRGAVLRGEVWANPAVFPDLTRGDVRAWWSACHEPFVRAGIAGFWNDMNEPSCFKVEAPDSETIPPDTGRGLSSAPVGKTLPDNARHGEKRHIEVHNTYGLQMSRASFEAARKFAPNRRPFVLTRAAYAGIQRYAAVWTGDNSSHWGHLELSIPMLLGLGLSGVPFVGSDVPGFLGAPNGELLVRWMQLGAFYPLMRNHSGKGTPPKEPWRFGEPYLSLARECLRRRYRLLPLLYTLMRRASETGVPPLLPVATVDPGDAEALRMSDQLLVGRGLLVAPVTRPMQSKRLVYLPRGRWADVSNLEPSGTILEGGRHLVADAPLDRIPLFLREGEAIPLTEPAPHTTTANWTSVRWLVHAADQVHGELYEDEGDGEANGQMTTLSGGFQVAGAFELRKSGTSRRRQESIVIVGLPGAPSSVEGAAAHAFDSGVLRVEVDAKWSTVLVRF